MREHLERLRDSGVPSERALEIAARLTASTIKLEMLEARQRSERRRAAAKSRAFHDKIERRREAASARVETAPGSSRRLPQRDKQLIDILGQHQKRGGELPCPLVAEKIQKKLRAIRIPSWNKTSVVLRATAYALQTHHEGGFAFSMNITPSVEKAARASRRGAASYIQDRIRKAMTKEFGVNDAPDFWLVAEASRTDRRLHVHGGITVDLTDRDLRRRVEASLMSAGGGWSSPSGKIYATDFRRMDQPLTWASYCLKDMNLTGSEVPNRLVTSTAGIRRRAQDRWGEMRALLQSFCDAGSPRAKS